MNEELQKKLVEKYPKILKDHGGNPAETCMAWGMDCGDGWYDILDKCMEKLQYFCDKCSTEERTLQVVAAQIKEKYGTLRFYIHGFDDINEIEWSIINMIIADAEGKSCYTCEACGDTTAKRCEKNNWLYTACEKCK
jgi:hypothetical protein